MQFNPELFDREADREFRRFFGWTGEQTWRNKIAKIDKSPQFSDADAYRGYVRQKNPLMVTINHYFQITRDGKTVSKHLDDSDKQVCGYLKLLNALAHNATEPILNRLRGSVLDDDSVKGFLFELDLAIHFFRLGYDVRFADLEGLGRYDLLVSDGTTEMEIECKRKTLDAGRKIRKGDFYLLADIVFGELKEAKNRFAILITSQGRMGADANLYRELTDAVKEFLKSGSRSQQVRNLKLNIELLKEGQEIKSEADLHQVLEPFGFSFSYSAVFTNRDTTIVIGCESAEPAKVLDAIYEEVKDGAPQLTGTRPALVGCLIEEIEDKDWKELQAGTGLQAVAARFFRNSSRRHVNLLAFSSDRTPPKREQDVLSFSAMHLDFWNPDPSFTLPKSFVFAS